MGIAQVFNKFFGTYVATKYLLQDVALGWIRISFPHSLNSTNIALILKGDVKTSLKDWRPITLFNVLYKAVAKVLANT